MNIIMDNRAVNFVDENNVLLGYELVQSCCEHAGWFIADRPDEWLAETFKQESQSLPGWVFDAGYCESFNRSPETDDGGGATRFRITCGDQQRFIVLYNIQNGYYSHGFKFTSGDSTIIMEGEL